jgi:replicative DNA helicase
MNIESMLLSKLIKTSDWSTIDEAQIAEKYFNGSYKRMFRFIRDFRTQYGKVPSKKEFSKKFPEFEFAEEIEEPLSYYCDELRSKVKHNMLADALEKAQDFMGELNSEDAYKTLWGTLLKIATEVIKTDMFKLGLNTEKRWEAYEKRKLGGGYIGTPTGYTPFDLMTGGINVTDIITILGFTNSGKTWILCIIAVLMAKAGYKILLLTREMSPEQLGKRIDAIYCNFSYTDFNQGTLSPQQEKQYKQYLQKIQDDENLVIEKVTGGVSSIIALCDKHQPEFVFIDGGYLMTDDSEEDDWKAVLDVWRGLKTYSLEKKIPFTITAQAKAGKASLTSVKFAQAIVDESDQVIFMEQTEEMFNDREIKFKHLKGRDVVKGKSFVCNWDFDKMEYGIIYQEQGSKKEEPKKELPKEKTEEKKKPKKILKKVV